MPSMFNDPDAWVQPDQYAAEFGALLNLYRYLAPRVVLEIGVREGGTFYQWMKYARTGTTLIGVDLPCGEWGRNITADYARFWRYAGQRSVTIQMILGDSHHPLTKAAIMAAVPGVDFLFIDGDHSRAGVEDDFNFYSKLVKPGGIIAVHDILKDETDRDIRVYEWWQTVKGSHTAEYISVDNQTTRGIGVISL